jgi:hypothetical protein
MDHLSDDEDNGARKSRRELPPGAVAHLKAWLLSPEHFTHPYPTPQDQVMLMQKTGIDKKQLKNWFTNARRRIWKPMLKKQLEAGKLVAHGQITGGTSATGGQVNCGTMVMVDNGLFSSKQQVQSSQQEGQMYGVQQENSGNEMYANFQQAQMQSYDDGGQQQVSLFVCCCVMSGNGINFDGRHSRCCVD